MKFVSVREFRSNTASVRRDLETEREIVLTSNGKPFAIMTPVEPDSVEDETLAIRRARARLAVERIRDHARKSGIDKMTPARINAEIAAVRRKLRGKR
jgi:antitoxin (DNA-binding transcriptional repressor) of toxin-antitoxin stability system